MPSCPTHGKELRTNSRGFYCPTKVGDGWCSYKPPASPAQGTIPQPQAPAAAPRGEGPGQAASYAQRDRLSAAQSALKFAGEMYSGQPDKIGSAMALAHRVYAEFLIPCRNGMDFPVTVYDPDDWWERAKQ